MFEQTNAFGIGVTLPLLVNTDAATGDETNRPEIHTLTTDESLFRFILLPFISEEVFRGNHKSENTPLKIQPDRRPVL